MSTGSLGALTTTFTPAPTCLGSSVMWLEHVGQGGGDYYVQLGPPWTRYPSCLPPNYLPVSTSYYSPGICPSGYTAACSSTVVEDNQQVTAEVCCPNVEPFSFFCGGPESTSILQNFPWFTTFGCWYSILQDQVHTVTNIQLDSNVLSTSLFTDGIFGAYAINVRRKLNDVIPPPTAAGPTSTTPTGTPEVSHSPAGISAGVAAGIGVGAGAGLILLALGLAAFMNHLRNRNRKSKPISPPQSHVDLSHGDFYTTQAEMTGLGLRAEVTGFTPKIEMEGSAVPVSHSET